MLGRGLVKRLAAISVVAASAFVAVVALGATTYFLLALVMVPAGAAALTGLLYVVIAALVAFLFLGKARGEHDDDDEDEMEHSGLGGRAYELFRQRPVLGTVAALAGGWIFLRNPALATMVAAAFTEKTRHPRR